MLSEKLIYWIGGSACAGKSTLAQAYADKYELKLYCCDDYFPKHLKKISEKKHPAMSKVATISFNEAFYTRKIDEQLSLYQQTFIEDFTFVINDLAEIPEKRIIVEGNQLLPSLVQPFLTNNHQAIWIIPTESFQREYYQKRVWIKDVLRETEDPEVAFDNWMKRDALFANLVYQEAIDLNLNVLKVDGRLTIGENFKVLENHFRC
ncbi:MAG: hypothetical protein ACK4M9_22030 [Anaerobacillus sp.]|uniref:hypothetical protein n=1 Tax=Anaerobacillus sp. TaxID=1872506 RepID=UPI00391ACF41